MDEDLPQQSPYPLRNFADLSPIDGDIDGDGCLDGLDDQTPTTG